MMVSGVTLFATTMAHSSDSTLTVERSWSLTSQTCPLGSVEVPVTTAVLISLFSTEGAVQV